MSVRNGWNPKREFTLEDAQNCVGAGWAHLVERCYRALEKERTPRLFQVKEKFGGLRFYVGPVSDATDIIIVGAEAESLHTCEKCGKLGKPRPGGWIKTLCDECAKPC